MDLRFPIAAVALLALLAAVQMGRARTPTAPTPPTNAQHATPAVVEPTDDEPTLKFDAWSLEVAAAARSLLDTPDWRYRDDCSGYVSSVYTHSGVPMDGTVAELYALAETRGSIHHHPIPRIGDIAFFDNTHDRNANGEWDDLRTHLGVVVDVEPDGTIVIAHKGSKRSLLRMNLMHPMTHEDETGREINGHLRRYGGARDTWAMYLSSQLWTAFATVDPELTWFGPSASNR